jgi:type IV secretory pathway TrbL component
MSLISILVVLLVVGVLLWAIRKLPIDPMVMNLIYVVVVVALVLWLLQAFGLLHGTGIHL